MFTIPKGTVNYYLYFLRLQHGYFYVGITKNLDRRLWEHCNGRGRVITRAHCPIRLECSWDLGKMSYEDASVIEDEFTLYFMSTYGRKVRGGRWCKNKENTKKILKKNPAYNPCNSFDVVDHDRDLG